MSLHFRADQVMLLMHYMDLLILDKDQELIHIDQNELLHKRVTEENLQSILRFYSLFFSVEEII